jgi:Hint domain/Right handed beta helix region
MTITDITTGQTFSDVSDAITDSNSGDVIDIPAGTYVEDFPKITHSLTLQGVGGLASLMTPGQPLNGEGILVQDAPSLTLDDLELSGAAVSDNNGAGVRMETGDTLTINDSWIHDNQDGLLVGAIPGATITINDSEFSNNGDGSGFTHNIYVGVIGLLQVTNSYFHDALGGHEIKSRADTTIIENNRIQDQDAASSYSIDLPNGGNATITGNVIEKGTNSANSSIVHFGGEITPVGPSSLDIENNTVIDNRPGTPIFVLNQSTDASGNPIIPTIDNNTFYGVTADELISGSTANAAGNTFNSLPGPTLDTSSPISCFLEGTHIQTTNGPKKVESLVVGDELMTLLEGKRTIIWIGKRTIDTPHRSVLPIRISTGAFAPGMPSSTLYLSPEHSVYWNGALLPVGLLTNGTSIQQVKMTKVTYFHVELSRHNVIIAEGLPVETYLDVGNRLTFTDEHVVVLYPNYHISRQEANGCAPIVMTGSSLEGLRAKLASRAKDNEASLREPVSSRDGTIRETSDLPIAANMVR